MNVIVQPELMERVVFEAARREPALQHEYERQFARCYESGGPDARDAAFRALHERWFGELGLRRFLFEIMDEFPHVYESVGRVVFALAPAPKAQSVDLYGAPGRFTVAVAMAVKMILDAEVARYWLRHELMHVDDMLNPEFGYDKAALPGGPTAAARNLARDRFAVLWAMSVDVRLAAKSQLPTGVRDRRRREFSLAFGRSQNVPADEAFDRQWNGPIMMKPTHRALLSLSGTLAGDRASTDPNQSMELQPQPNRAPIPGALCPACSFPTFDWASQDTLRAIGDVVAAELPSWDPAYGLCRRCAELYRSRRSCLLGAT